MANTVAAWVLPVAMKARSMSARVVADQSSNTAAPMASQVEIVLRVAASRAPRSPAASTTTPTPAPSQRRRCTRA
ncbi:hypothetical protein [Nannocystis sp.]|uniref:hypothetical protein n=1 Tax=Nannocystis sp. TaxID=1962667 RepID=UPI0025CE97AC|nr:hypothetical protein [Nannocystis sp.]MBK7827559.1 hypothetical protein [Nannocystis sp.]